MEIVKELNALKTRDDFYHIINKYNHKKIAEVGVMEGEFLSKLMKSNAQEIWAVDIWDYGVLSGNPSFIKQEDFDKYYFDLLKKSRQDNRLSVMKMSSFKAFEFFPNEFFDVVYIDADHTYEAVKRDIENWWPKVKKNGILCGHDYVEYGLNGIDFGVINAVNEFITSNNLKENFAKTQEHWSSWFIYKI